MPRTHPPEFRQRAVELARLREKPIAQIADDLGISESCLRNWVAQADVDEGRRDGLGSNERAELVELRRELRVTKMENEIHKRAAAYLARENVLALHEGIDIKVVSDRLNHSSTFVTREIYTHVTPPMQSDAAERVAASIFGQTLNAPK